MEEAQESMPNNDRSTRSGKRKAPAEPLETSGVGELLREERRRRSLDRSDVAAKTRLREYIIEAIEKEAWDELPQPVFVRGFIRSYAQALGIDEAKVLDLYNRARPEEPAEPRPLVAPEESGRGKRILLTLFLGFLGALLLYLWQGAPAPEWPSAPQQEGVSDSDSPGESTGKGIGEPEPPQAVLPPAEDTAEPRAEPEPDEEALDEVETRIAELAVPPPADRPSMQAVVEGDSGQAAGEETDQIQAEEEYPAGPPFILKARVKQRTWVKISVDGQEPKEFLFQPGSRPEWEAEEGFEMVIGNAGGIVLELNGRVLDELGASGQVIRLELPEDLDELARGER